MTCRQKVLHHSPKEFKVLIEFLHCGACGIMDACFRRWKSSQMAMEMVGLLTRDDILLPAEGVTVFVKNLNHETIQVRKV